jgi:hypothetical protein
MVSPRHRRPLAAALCALAAFASSACSAGGETKPAPAAPAPSAEAPVAQSSGEPIGISPGGVTTRIEMPAQSTEEQYAQACLTAKDWMAAKGGDPDTLVEPYLKDVQASSESSPATFRKTWAELTDPERAAVIIAVRAAADGGC